MPDACGVAAAARVESHHHDKFTADPAPLIVGDRLYLYVGMTKRSATDVQHARVFHPDIDWMTRS
jgi:hypothetical protein